MASLSGMFKNRYLLGRLGACAGIVACFLPWYQFGQFSAFVTDRTNGITHWRGTLSFVCFLLALGFSLLPGWGLLKLEKRTVDLSLTACGAGAFLFSLLYLIGANYGSTQLSQMSEFGPAFGAYLSLVAGAVVGISGMLSQKDSSKNEAAN